MRNVFFVFCGFILVVGIWGSPLAMAQTFPQFSNLGGVVWHQSEGNKSGIFLNESFWTPVNVINSDFDAYSPVINIQGEGTWEASNGFSLQFSLTYDSGSGNTPFGFGWNLSLPSISRKTGDGLPQYPDGDESDTSNLICAEDPLLFLNKQCIDRAFELSLYTSGP